MTGARRRVTTQRRSKWLMALVTVVAIVFVAEITARIAFSVYEDFLLEELWFVRTPELGWAPRPGYSGKVYREERRFDGSGHLAVDSGQIDSSRPKLVTLGDSVTFGYGVDVEDTFAERLDRMFPDLDVVNLAVPGYSSEQGKLLAERVGRLAPEIVIVSFNANDRRYLTADELSDGPERFARVGRRDWESVLETAHLFRGLRFLLKSAGLVAREGGEPRELVADTLKPRVAPDAYAANLREIVEQARGHGAEVLFLLLKDNPVHTRRLREGLAALEEGRQAEAVAALETAVELDNSFSVLARVQLAQAYRLAGEESRAAEVGRLVAELPLSVHGGEWIRTDSEYNDRMLSVARRLSVGVVDPRSVLDAEATVYLDDCHVSAYGHGRIAELLRDAVRRIREGE